MVKVFISAPFFSDKQVFKVEQVEKALKDNPTVDEFYSPRLHQEGDGYTPFSYEWSNATYHHDINGVKKADATVEILDFDNDDADAGTAYEHGYAKAIGKFTTTISFDDYPTNLMLGIGSDYHFSNADQLRKYDFNKKPTNRFNHRMH